MKSFNDFELRDFLDDESFRRWVYEQAPEPEADWWEEFAIRYPDKTSTVVQARRILLAIQEDTFAPAPEVVQRNIDQIMQATRPARRWINRSVMYQQMSWVAAASVAFLLLAGLVWFREQEKPTAVYSQLVASAKMPMKEVVNTGAKTKLVLLADGSSILLQPNSRISYPRSFATQARREVYLVGEAFFEVAKNPNKPFFVYADNLITKVLGTSFTVRAYDKDAVDVTVKTGKVSVFTRSDKDQVEKRKSRHLTGLVLSPNQWAHFDHDDDKLIRSLVESPALLDMPIQRSMFEFTGTPVKEVFAELEKAYGVEIVFDAEVMKNCYLTASLEDEPLFEKLNMICRTLDAQHEQLDGKILISSKGCQ